MFLCCDNVCVCLCVCVCVFLLHPLLFFYRENRIWTYPTEKTRYGYTNSASKSDQVDFTNWMSFITSILLEKSALIKFNKWEDAIIVGKGKGVDIKMGGCKPFSELCFYSYIKGKFKTSIEN